MQGEIVKKPTRSNDLLFPIAGCVLGLLIGAASGLFSGLVVLGILLGLALVFIILKRPEVGLLSILIATSSIVFEEQLPQLPIAGISLHISDFLLVGLLGLIAVRWVAEPQFKILRTPLDWPLLIFYTLTLFWTLLAISNSSVDVVSARRLLRIVSYYLTFFVVTNLVRDRRQLNFLLNSLLILSSIVAVVIIVQYVLGGSVTILPGRLETLTTEGIAYEAVTRIGPPGLSIVLVAFVTIFCILVLEKFGPLSVLKYLQFALLGAAILFTFLRSYWAALIIVFFLMLFVFKGYDRQNLIRRSIFVLYSVMILIMLVFSVPDSPAARLVNASGVRLGTIFKVETFQGQDSSFNWRRIENGYAYAQIKSNPWVGLGMSGRYRPFDAILDADGDGRTFIHNGHLWILLDTGLLGYLAFMSVSLIFLFRGFRYWSSVSDYRLRGVVLGFTLVYLAILIAAYVNSTFVQWRWTPLIGMLMGINEVILARFQNESIKN